MTWLAELDTALFRWVNHAWANSFLDGLMPLMSGEDLLPVGFLIVAAMAWKMGRRGIPAILCLAAIIGLGEGLILSPLKEGIGRLRPPYTLPDVRLLVGLGGSGSMPSAHAANWGCATMILTLFYRPSLFLTVPLACVVSLSRVYNGVHYPGDVTAGLLLGAGYGWAGVMAANWAWQQITQRHFPKAFAFLPSFLPPGRATDRPTELNASSPQPKALPDP